jgi:hypothetical protein
LEQRRQFEALQKENEELKDSVDKLKNRSSQNSSVPPSTDQVKKPSDKSKRKKGKKRGPKYNHPGTTRNGFGTPDLVESLELENCRVCGADVEPVAGAPYKVQQVAELVEQPVSIREYHDHCIGVPNVAGQATHRCRGASKKDLAMVADCVALWVGSGTAVT